MSLLQTLLKRNRRAAVWGAIALAGAAMGYAGYRREQTVLLRQLVQDVRRSALVFEPAELGRLTATRADVDAPVYAGVKHRLRRLAAVDPRVRFAYLFRPAADGVNVLYLADSAVPGAKDESLPGDPYPQAVASPGLQEVLRTGQPATEGPLADDFGTWVTAYAAVGLAEGETPAGRRDLLGIDIAADHWRRELWWSAFEGALYVWLVLGLPFAALLVTRRQDEQREVIRNLSQAMEQSASAIMIVDPGSRIEYVNRGLCRQLGFTRRELLGRAWRDFQVAQAPESVLAEMVATVRSGRSWEGEWTNRRKDGTVYPVRGVVTPVKHEDGALACFVAVLDDVTETKRREAELREARDLAQAGDRAKGQFLATMSHEVRTPLNGIVGFTSLLLETPLTAEQRECVQTIRLSTEALIQLTGDILDFARIESGKLKLDPLACDPAECVEDALDLLAARAAEKRLELLHRTAADVPAAVVTDGGRLRQVLVNLVGNALKFTDRGEVEVSVRRVPEPAGAPATEGPESCLLEFSVRDTGIGIAPEHHGRLFRAFSQVDESTTRRYGGTGLGLAICRNLVELMGGTIALESAAGRGSTFRFTIRAEVAAGPAAPRRLPGLNVGLAARPGPWRDELAALLRSWEVTVQEAPAADQLAGGDWSLALVDIDAEIAREWPASAPLEELPAAKLIGLVPVTLGNEARTALRAHCHLLVNKPVHREALFGLLSGSRPEAAVPVPPTHFGFRVLVAEDNPVNRKLISRVLANLGCHPTLVENGREALNNLAAHADKYDLVLLDLHMPELDGLGALREIRAGKAGPRAQVMWIVALTADAREQQRTEALSEGLNDYLTKPLRLPELEAALRRFRDDRLARKG